MYVTNTMDYKPKSQTETTKTQSIEPVDCKLKCTKTHSLHNKTSNIMADTSKWQIQVKNQDRNKKVVLRKERDYTSIMNKSYHYRNSPKQNQLQLHMMKY